MGLRLVAQAPNKTKINAFFMEKVFRDEKTKKSGRIRKIMP